MNYKCEVCGKGLGDSLGWNALGDRRIHSNCQWVEIDRLRDENQRLRAELEALRPQEDRGIPILGEVRDGKIEWLGVDMPPRQEEE